MTKSDLPNWIVTEDDHGHLTVVAKIDNAFDVVVGEPGAHRPRRVTVHAIDVVVASPANVIRGPIHTRAALRT